MDSQNPAAKLNELIVESLEGAISADNFARLETMLADDPSALQYYAEFLMVNTGLRSGGISENSFTPEPLDEKHDPVTTVELLREIIDQGEKARTKRAAEEEQRVAEAVRKAAKEAAEAAFRKFQEQEQRLNQKPEPRHYSYKLNERPHGLIALAASLIIVVLVLYFGRKPDIPVAPQAIATLTRTLNAKWDDSTLPTTTGSELFAGEMRLTKGYAQITFIDGAEVVLQAPVQFKLETDEQMFLQNGRLTAKVPPGAEGFKLNTPNAMMIDLGTEFGVVVSETGQSELHVFQGEVKLFSDKRTGGNIYKQTFRTGQAGVIDKNGQLSKKTYKATPRYFIRNIPKKMPYGRPGKRLDLSDVIGGGNGFGTGDPNQSINPDDGERRPGFYNRNGKTVSGSSDFVTVTDLDFIDGVFVPNGGNSPVVISSDGHTFNNCPDTSGKFCWDIFNGNVTIEGQCRQQLDGIKYGTFTHPAISMHSNSGITFDLDKIRESLPGNRIVAFSMLCGLAKATYDSIADFWVLVDGQKRFSMTGARWQDRAKSVRINLSDHDKFLTIAIIDGSNTPGAGGEDWGIFAKPALILAPAGRE
jgi:ferric-dicitrate binding protein FerR (iron transport regulator)